MIPSLPDVWGFIIFDKPFHGDIHRLFKWSKFEVWEVLPELGVVCSFLELPIRLTSVERNLTLEIQSLGDSVCDGRDGNLVFFTNCETKYTEMMRLCSLELEIGSLKESWM